MLLFIFCKFGFHKYKIINSIKYNDLINSYINENLGFNYKLHFYKNKNIMINDYECIRCGNKINNIKNFKNFKNLLIKGDK